MTALFTGNMAVQEQSRVLFRFILSNRPASRPMMLNRLNLPPTTLNRVIDRLLAAGLIEESGQAESTGGRPASLFQINPEARLLMGISLTGNKASLVLLDLLLQPVASREIEWQLTAGESSGQPSVADAALELVCGPGKGRPLLGAGIHGADLHTDSDRVALQSMLGERLGCPVICEEGLAGMGLLLSRLTGSADGDEPIALFGLGEDITLALSNRLPDSVCTPYGPTIGCLLADDPLADKTLQRLPLKELLTPAAIGRRFAALRGQETLVFDDFLAACRLEKKKAMRLLAATATVLAQAAFSIACVSGIQDVVLNGFLIESMPLLVTRATERMTYLNQTGGTAVRLVLSPFGADLPAASLAAQVLARELA